MVEEEKPIVADEAASTAGAEVAEETNEILQSFFDEEEEEEESAENGNGGGGNPTAKPSQEEKDVVKVPKAEYDRLVQESKDFATLRNDPEYSLYFTAKTQGVSVAKQMIDSGVFSDWDTATEQEVFMAHAREVYSDAGLEASDLEDMYDDFKSKSSAIQKVELKRMRDEMKKKSADKASEFAMKYEPVNPEEAQKQIRNQILSFGETKKVYKGINLADTEAVDEIFDTVLNAAAYINDKDGKPKIKALVDVAIALNPKLSKKSLGALLSEAKTGASIDKLKKLSNPKGDSKEQKKTDERPKNIYDDPEYLERRRKELEADYSKQR